jgi:hypothetical protein
MTKHSRLIKSFDLINVFAAHQRCPGFLGRGTRSSTTRYNEPFTPRNTTQSTIPNRAPITTGPPNQSAMTNRPKCFKCGEPGHRITDCRKGEKYGKGLLIDSGNAFDEQGDEEEQVATFDDYGDVE